MDNNVCPVSVSPWQPNYLPADLSDVSWYTRAVSGDPSLGKWLRIAISEITSLATWVIICPLRSKVKITQRRLCLSVLIVTCLARWSIPMSGQQGGAEWESTCKLLSPGLTDSWVGWDRGQPCDISANQGLSKVKKWPIRGRISEGSVGSCIGRELTQKRIVIKAPWTNLISPCWQSNWFQVR